MDSTNSTDSKSFAQSKYSRQNYHKQIGARFIADCAEHLKDKFNNPDSYTNATIKHPHFCPTGAKCVHCRRPDKGWMKSSQRMYAQDM
jgi:hypothetical protein